jgi:hypothetical protein
MANERDYEGHETVTAVFETRAEALTALDRLRRDDIPVDAARLRDGAPETGDDADRETRQKGFWQSLGDLFLPHEDRGAYAEALACGGTLLSLPVSAADRARVLALLDAEGTVDLDEREGRRWSGGWGGPVTSPGFGDTSLTSPRDDAGLRSGISGIGAHAAGAPPARFARRNEAFASSRVRSYRFDSAPGEAARASEVEIEDRRPGEEREGTGTIHRTT